MNARELHDEECFREWLAHWRDHAANAPVVNGYWKRIERALSLLASVEESKDEVAIEVNERANCLEHSGHPITVSILRKAAAALVHSREEIERKDAEIAELKGHAEGMEHRLRLHLERTNDIGTKFVLDAYRRAHPKE